MKSKFSGIFAARQQEAATTVTEEAEAPSEVTEATAEPNAEAPAPPSPAPAQAPAPKARRAERRDESTPSPQPAPPSRPRGRPAGKRSNGEYAQVTAYIRRDTHLAVKQALLTDGGTKEFSELVQELLTKWLKART